MNNFTPGPWEVEESDHMSPTGVFGTDAAGRDWTICDMGVPIELACNALEDLHPQFAAQQLANAHLIAAAPDFYAAACALELLLRQREDELGQLSPEMEAIAVKNRAAIARARGEVA